MTYFIFAVCICFWGVVNAQNQEVTINSGTVIGKTETLAGYSVKKFLGIPFAEPPIGPLRLKKPKPAKALSPSPYNATFFRPYCVQTYGTFNPKNGEESEDCLYLNVYAPTTPADNSSGHAVMVWIYGGGFQDGLSDIYDSSAIAAIGNVIVVTLNYRVGILGFFNTMDEAAPGNYGLYDQLMAIQWVHENIAAFGGDVNRVTIFGESAGAMSVVMHGLYPANHGKFHRIIAQSGSPIGLELFPFDYDKTVKLAKQLQCSTDSLTTIANCMRNLSVQDIKSVYNTIQDAPLFGPVVDGDIIKFRHSTIPDVLQTRELDEVNFFRSLDFITGVNAYEGAYFLGTMGPAGGTENFNPGKKEFLAYVKGYLEYSMKQSVDSMASLVAHEYNDWPSPDNNEYRLQFVKILGDRSMVVPTVVTSRIHAHGASNGNTDGSTFLYHFLPAPENSVMGTPSWVPGANHGDELLFVFGGVFLSPVQDWQTLLATNVIQYWTNFAKTGNPNMPQNLVTKWPEFNTSTEEYLIVEKSLGPNSTGRYLGARETSFWSYIMPGLMNEVTSDKVCDDNVTSASSTVRKSMGFTMTCVCMVLLNMMVHL